MAVDDCAILGMCVLNIMHDAWAPSEKSIEPPVWGLLALQWFINIL